MIISFFILIIFEQIASVQNIFFYIKTILIT